MRKLLLVLLLLLTAPCAFGDVSGSAACPTGSLGNSVTCVTNEFYDSTTAPPQTSVTANFGALTQSHDYLFFGYAFCSSACDDSQTLAFGTNLNNPDSCFVASGISPAKTNSNGGVMYEWYCTSLTSSGATNFTMTCTAHTSQCGFLSYFGYELTGGCTSTPCIDKSAVNDSSTSSIQSVTVSTGSAVAYTNELSSAFCTNNNNEQITVSSPYIAVYSSAQEATIPGNMVGAKGIGTGVASATMTWTGNDGVVCLIMTVKTPSSVAVAGNKTAMPCVIGDAMSEHREVYAWIREDDEV
jgi:hypothetical protein